MNLEQFFPAARPWVESLAVTPPGNIIKPQFASWEVTHILSLIALGGSSILLSLRLLGVGLTQESPSELYRNLRIWQHIGVIGIIVSGLLIGSANAERLYDSAAFIVKMLGLTGGVILTYGASRPIAKADGVVSGGAKLALVVGSIFWFLGLWLFAASGGISPGVYHVIFAAALMAAFATSGGIRRVYLGGLAMLLVVHQVLTHVVYKGDDFDHLNPVNVAFACIFTVWVVGAALFQMSRAQPNSPTTTSGKLAAYATILVWVTAAAAGRWIAFA